jgi:ATP-dependent helicase YprA (DUF1998 family)
VIQPFHVASQVLDSYRRYVRASFPLNDPVLDAQRERLIDENLLWNEPYVQLAQPGAAGPTLSSLTSLLDPRTVDLPWGFDQVYAHQDEAIRRLAVGQPEGPRNTLILSGTGSGKTESFLIPIVDACIRDDSPGVKAVVIYPMNALANDQLQRLRRLLAGEPAVSFGRYTGDTPETDQGDVAARGRPGRPSDWPVNGRWSRQAIREEPPSILLTNYTMLEYLLLRRRDAELFRHGPPRYVVVDEIHLFTGVLGAETANLLRRFRQHVAAAPQDLCFVGTSATAGGPDERDRLVQFASTFFGSPFDAAAAIEERPMPPRPRGPVVPPTPQIDRDLLVGANRPAGLAALGRVALGVDVPGDDETACSAALGEVIDRYATVGVVEEALRVPAPLTEAATALGQLPERAAATEAELLSEATALVLLGAAAWLPPVGEGEARPRLRPRVHQVLRTLAGLVRCLNQDCGQLLRPEHDGCPQCDATTLPLATCRTCGEAYWAAAGDGPDVFDTALLRPFDGRRGHCVLLRPAGRAAGVDEFEDETTTQVLVVAVCPQCGGLGTEPSELRHDRSCAQRLAVQLFAATADRAHCRACGSSGARTRPVILPLQGSAAASVAVLTASASGHLRANSDEAGGRLLVFADSRQDAAQQAGYSDDQGARVAVRQLVVDVLGGGPLSLDRLAIGVADRVLSDRPALRRWLIGESTRSLDAVADADYVPSADDERAIKDQLHWEVVLELTERSRRRFSLEQEGLLAVTIDRLDELVDTVVRRWPGHPFQSPDLMAETIVALADAMRYRRIVDHWMLKRTPRELIRNHHVRLGDRAVSATKGYGPRRVVNGGEQIDIRAWVSGRGVSQPVELLARALDVQFTDAGPLVEQLAGHLERSGLLVASRAGAHARVMVDHHRVIVGGSRDQLWRCERCGLVRSSVLHNPAGDPICVNWKCSGRPTPYMPDPARDFYRGQYRAEPRRLIVREHSGQIETEQRLSLEQRFNDRDNVTVDVLACTPTLEVGVSLDDLHAVLLRNLPPTPANYAQRVGRAGRRTKVALTFAHASHAPHDSYYFEEPGELIAGLVRTPAINLDNEPLLRRHINSLVFETIGIDLPTRWVPPLDDPAAVVQTVADADGVLRESVLAPIDALLSSDDGSERVRRAVRGAFASPSDAHAPVLAADVCDVQLARFGPELRAALGRWCDRYRGLLDELRRLSSVPGVPTKADEEARSRVLSELRRVAEPASPEYQPLGFLGLVGFLPRYGFTGESVLLHQPGTAEPIVQAGRVAITEFAPENVVYARGRKLKVRRLDPPPRHEGDVTSELRENIIRVVKRCPRCAVLSFNQLVKACPTCGSDLPSQPVIELTGVRATGGSISSEDEYRTRSDYDLDYRLDEAPSGTNIVTLGGLRFEQSSRREVVVANRGLRRDDGSAGAGFDLCIGCGWSVEAEEIDADAPSDETESTGHAPRCPGRTDSRLIEHGVWLTARVRGDVLEIEVPRSMRGAGASGWRATLAEALRLGVQETMQAGRRDIEWFERVQDDEIRSVVLFDTMPGGTGYLPKLVAGGAVALRQAASVALTRLSECRCNRSCHRCLRDFWNQRDHQRFDRWAVIGQLRRLTEVADITADEAEDDWFDSFLEVEFFERLNEHGLPAPTLQVTREVGSRAVTIVDASYASPNVSIFLDGRAYHAASRAKVIDDLERRNQLEASGQLLLEFTYGDVVDHFEDVVALALRSALGHEVHGRVDLTTADGVTIVRQVATDQGPAVVVRVDPDAWVNDEKSRQRALARCNTLRLAGHRLHRVWD